MTYQWQEKQVYDWTLRHMSSDMGTTSTYESFKKRIAAINGEVTQRGLPPRITKDAIGSLGAYDCTYSIRPGISAEILNQNDEDPRVFFFTEGGDCLFLIFLFAGRSHV